MVKIINPGNTGDYHMHSSDFSDGRMSVEEIIKISKELGLKEIAITDHSQVIIDYLHSFFLLRQHHQDKTKLRPRRDIFDLSEIKNTGINVIYGIEADILNEKGDICSSVDYICPDFMILSAHSIIFDKDKDITKAYINAIERHYEDIRFIAHPCKKDFSDKLDIKKVVQCGNKYKVPFEVNGVSIMLKDENSEMLEKMVKLADRIYVNSDAHDENQLRTARQVGFDFLKKIDIYPPK